MAGDAVEENATGYLMRNTQWLVQEIGVGWLPHRRGQARADDDLNYFDRAVFRANPRLNLDGSERRVFSYGEVFDTNRQVLRDHVRKDGFNPNVVGGNRDVLDFAMQGALKDNLTGNGLQNDWRNVVNAGLDTYDDGLHNGSMGVLFVGSHDDGTGPQLNNVAHAYTLMQPGNAVVYFNGKEFGDNRNFPKDGRGDALGGRYRELDHQAARDPQLARAGNYQERWIEKENLAFRAARLGADAAVQPSRRRVRHAADGCRLRLGHDARRIDRQRGR
jgi:hypothetical protein